MPQLFAGGLNAQPTYKLTTQRALATDTATTVSLVSML